MSDQDRFEYECMRWYEIQDKDDQWIEQQIARLEDEQAKKLECERECREEGSV